MTYDPYWAQVALALDMEGADGSTTIIDLKGHAVTAYNGAALSTAQKRFGSSSCYFDGVNDRVSLSLGATPGPPPRRAATAARCPHCGTVLRRLAVNTTPANQTGDASTAVLLCVRCHYEEWR